MTQEAISSALRDELRAAASARTLRTVAREAGVKESALGHFVSGRVQRPSEEPLAKLHAWRARYAGGEAPDADVAGIAESVMRTVEPVLRRALYDAAAALHARHTVRGATTPTPSAESLARVLEDVRASLAGERDQAHSSDRTTPEKRA